MRLPPRFAVFAAFPLLCGLIFLAGSLGDDSTSEPSKVPPEPPQTEGAANVPDDHTILSPITLESERESETRIRRAMQTKFQDLPSEITAAALVDQISKIGKINVSLDRPTLQDEGVDLTQKITRKLNGASIESAMNRVFANLNLDWIIRGETLQITTVHGSQEYRFTRVYNLRPLRLLFEAHPARSYERPKFSTRPSGGGFFSVGTNTLRTSSINSMSLPILYGPSMLFGAYCGEANADENSFAEAIVDGFRELHDSWERPGFTILNGTDLVSLRHYRRTHDRFASYLRALEAIVDGTGSKRAAQAVPATYPAKDDDAINQKLQHKTSLQYQDVPLNAIRADIARKNGIDVATEEKAFTDEGIDVREPFTCHLDGVPLGAGLKELFRNQNLAFYVAEGELVVTTINGEQGHDIVVLYDVLDLVSGDVDEGMQRISDLVVEGSSGNWMSGDVNEIDTPFPGVLLLQAWPAVHEEVASLLDDLRRENNKNRAGAQPEANDQTLETRFYNVADYESVDDVLAAIPQFVAPDSWKIEAGTAIRKVGRTLAIRQTEKVHRQIDKFLKTLKSEQGKSTHHSEASNTPESPLGSLLIVVGKCLEANRQKP